MTADQRAIAIAVLVTTVAVTSMASASGSPSHAAGAHRAPGARDVPASSNHVAAADAAGVQTSPSTAVRMPQNVGPAALPVAIPFADSGSSHAATQFFSLAGHYGGSAGPVALFGARAVVGFSRQLAVLDLTAWHEYPPIAGYVVMPASIDSIAPVWTGHPSLAAGHVLAGVARHGVYIVNCGDPANPRIVGRWADARDHYTDIAWRGNLVYVTAWSGSGAYRTSALLVLDVSRPSKPGLVAAMALPGRYADAVHLDGDRAFVANGWNGMTVVDISDPTAPKVTAQTGTGGYASSLALTGRHVYLIDGGVPRSEEAAAGRANTRPVITVLDVTSPDRPVEVGFVPTPGRPIDMAMEANYLYVAEHPYADGDGTVSGGGIRAYDVSAPAAPVEGGVVPPPDGALIERLASEPVVTPLVATFGSAGLTTNSIRSPVQPEQIAHRPGTAVPAACDLARLDTRLYASWAGDVYELRVFNPKWIGSTTALPRWLVVEDPVAAPGDACALAVADGGLLLVGDGSQLLVYDATEPGRLSELSRVGGADWGVIRDISITGDQVYIAESPRLEGTSYIGGGLRVLGIEDPLAPTELGLLIERSNPHLASSSSDTVIAADDETLWVFDADESGMPVETAIKRLVPGTHDLAIHAGHALIAQGRCEESWDAVVGKGGLDIVDLDTLEAVAHVNTASAHSVALEGDIAYVATRCGGTEQPITAVDVSQPDDPRHAGRLDGEGGEVHVSVSDGLLLRIGEQPVLYGDELLAFYVSRARQAFLPMATSGSSP